MDIPYEYTVVLPEGYKEGERYPVLFALHGKGSNERDLLGLAEPLKDEFILIGIRGDLPMGQGYQYYELRSLGNPIRELFDRAVARLEAFIEYASEQYAVDPERRYVLGFSQGAILAMTLALTMGDRIKGIVALNGYVPDFVKTEYPLQSVTNMSIFISHGEFDPVFPIKIGHETAAYLNSLNDRVIFRTYPCGHEVTGANRQELLTFLREDSLNSHVKE
ncbi:phospholipase/carboxylesterase [Paenibacillus forsythiae]|uniref:Phospholipase/carboxylesterase n=1 Tax=Paenibacillus forsythiae TaxID=365616 RepID=A0ABU3H9P2_9BACL|nr:alpha/beta hydrolase-fold protein [Paenibacillus forsythiae]MDT3426420.1 phospholipase/carboxylesterase [Paenibacillus forsythiae]